LSAADLAALVFGVWLVVAIIVGVIVGTGIDRMGK
jgi:hypothetical protein